MLPVDVDETKERIERYTSELKKIYNEVLITMKNFTLLERNNRTSSGELVTKLKIKFNESLAIWNLEVQILNGVLDTLYLNTVVDKTPQTTYSSDTAAPDARPSSSNVKHSFQLSLISNLHSVLFSVFFWRSI